MNQKQQELQCILCAKNSSDGSEHKITNAHVISKCIGGWIKVPFLCKKCNNQVLGSSMESTLKQNAYIVTAIDQLGLQTKDKAYNRAKISINFENETSAIGWFTKDGMTEFHPSKQPDGSIVVSESDSKKVLAKQVRRYERDNKISVPFNDEMFDSAPYDVLVNIPKTDISFIKRGEIEGFTQISNLKKPVPFIIPMSIAFATMAGFSYEFVIQPSFDHLRDWILKNELENKVIIHNPIDQSQIPTSFKYEPFHYVRYSVVEDGFVALVVLFNQISFSVFMGFNVDISLLPDQNLLDTYIIYDLENRELISRKPPKEIFDEDTLCLTTVYHTANYELRLKS